MYKGNPEKNVCLGRFGPSVYNQRIPRTISVSNAPFSHLLAQPSGGGVYKENPEKIEKFGSCNFSVFGMFQAK